MKILENDQDVLIELNLVELMSSKMNEILIEIINDYSKVKLYIFIIVEGYQVREGAHPVYFNNETNETLIKDMFDLVYYRSTSEKYIEDFSEEHLILTAIQTQLTDLLKDKLKIH